MQRRTCRYRSSVTDMALLCHVIFRICEMSTYLSKRTAEKGAFLFTFSPVKGLFILNWNVFSWLKNCPTILINMQILSYSHWAQGTEGAVILVARFVSTASTFSSSCFATYSVKNIPWSQVCNGPIKFLTKTVWLTGHRLHFVVCWRLTARSQETGSEADAAARTHGGLIGLIDLHYRGLALRAGVSLCLCADLMPSISPQNQLTNT